MWPYQTRSIYGDRVVTSLPLSGACFFPLWEEKKYSPLKLKWPVLSTCPNSLSLRFWAFGFPSFPFFIVSLLTFSLSRISSNRNKRLVRIFWSIVYSSQFSWEGWQREEERSRISRRWKLLCLWGILPGYLTERTAFVKRKRWVKKVRAKP